MKRAIDPLWAAATMALLVSVHSGAQEPPAPTSAPLPAIAPANRSALSPEARQPTLLPDSQRNPFGAAAVPVEEEEQEAVAAETEEAKLRRILGTMRVTGLSGSPGSYSLVVGSLLLREGEPVPRLFANQAEQLKVDSVTEKEVILSFVERSPEVPPRLISLRFDLSPPARSVLPGELFQAMVPTDAKGKIQLAEVEPEASKQIEQGLKEQDFEGLVERRFRFMGAPVFPRDDEKPASQP